MLYKINGKKVLFIHIPKTAGTSVENKLEKFAIKKNLKVHCDYKQSIQLLEEKPDLIFTIIRNPWDWRSSWYFFMREASANLVNTGHPKEENLQKN